MIPLTVSGPELALARSWVEEAVAAVGAERGAKKSAKQAGAKAGQLEVTIGTMVETPRAALVPPSWPSRPSSSRSARTTSPR